MEKQFITLGEGVNVGMSAAVRFGDQITVSGQVALNERGVLIGRDDFSAQTEQCFANLTRILEQAGSSLGQIVSLTTYIADREHVPIFLAARARHFPTNPPATTTVIAQMLYEELLIEIQALATIA